MAALGKIRSRGLILICIIGFGLFAFIAEELFRSCESSRNDQRQQVGEVLGEKISVQDFQKLLDEYQEVIKMQQGTETLSEEQLNQVKDMVWNTYVQSKLVEKEAKELGLTVTDTELQDVLKAGTNPMLLQTPFVNQQTGRFDAASLQKFLADFKANKAAVNPQMQEQYQKIYNYWTFIEKTLRQQLLAQKYQGLLAHCFLSNPVEAKMAFEDENQESQINLAAFPYSDIADNKVTVEESDLKAKYDQLKARFYQPMESRDIKYVDIEVSASPADRAALQKECAGYRTQLAAAADPAEVVRKSGSLVEYIGVPVPRQFFPQDVAAQFDSMAVGVTSAVKESTLDNSLTIVRLLGKVSLPDSVQFRSIQIGGETAAKASATADSVYTALQGGADFEALAKKYGQTGAKTWATAQQLVGSLMQSNTPDQKSMVNAVRNGEVNKYHLVKLTQGSIIVQVTARKAFSENYTAAVIKKTNDFSKDTYRTVYNKFASFVSANSTGADIEKNAEKAGYRLQTLNDMTTSTHNVANIHSTREALKWIFEAKEGEVSPMYECGDNNHLLIVVLDKIHNAGYRDMNDAQVKEMLKAEVIRDKKAEQLMAKVKGVTGISAAKAKGAKVSMVNQVTFAAPVFVPLTGSSEPALSGAVAATKKGQFSTHAVKGAAGVYLVQVTGRTMRPGKFDDKAQEAKLAQRAMQYAGNYMNELYLNGNVVDNRYLFF